MRTRDVLFGLLFLYLISSIAYSAQQELPQLFIRLSIDVSDEVTISGKITGMKENAVPEAVISIQVIDPFGSTIHIARVLSVADGSFSNIFALNPRIAVGTYSLHITATKEGYSDARYTASFLVSRRDFMITITESATVIEQGETATFNMNLIGIGVFNETIYLALGSALPQGVTSRFSVEYVKPNASLTFTLVSSPDTPTGNYTVLIVASGGGRSHSASTTLVIVARRGFASVVWAALAIAVITAAAYMALKRGTRRIIPLEELELTKEDLIATKELVELEKLRADGRIDEAEYNRLKRQYERKIHGKS